MEARLGELNHLSTLGREIKRDSESSGERNWNSLNHSFEWGCRAAGAFKRGGVRRKLYYSRKVLGKPDREGEIPVCGIIKTP